MPSTVSHGTDMFDAVRRRFDPDGLMSRVVWDGAQVSVNFAHLVAADGACVIVQMQTVSSSLATMADAVLTIPAIETQQFGAACSSRSAC